MQWLQFRLHRAPCGQCLFHKASQQLLTLWTIIKCTKKSRFMVVTWRTTPDAQYLSSGWEGSPGFIMWYIIILISRIWSTSALRASCTNKCPYVSLHVNMCIVFMDGQLLVLFTVCLPKIVLILLPHLMCNPILSHVGLDCFVLHHLTCSRFPNKLMLLTHLELNCEVIISLGLYSQMKLWSAASTGGMRAWMFMLYSGGLWRIQKHHLRIPKICSTTLWADTWHKLNNSFTLHGLKRMLENNFYKKKNTLLIVATTPFTQMVPHVLIWDKKRIQGGKASIHKVILPAWDVEIILTGIIEKCGVMCGPFPTRQNIHEAKVKGTCNKAVLSENTLAVPWCIAVFSRWEASNVGAIYST